MASKTLALQEIQSEESLNCVLLEYFWLIGEGQKRNFSLLIMMPLISPEKAEEVKRVIRGACGRYGHI